MNDLPLAQVLPQDVAPVIVSAIVFMIPIIAILTSHQRKMAEIIHGKSKSAGEVSPMVYDKLLSLEREVAELRDTVRRQTIQLDSLPTASGSVGAGGDELSSRIGGN